MTALILRRYQPVIMSIWKYSSKDYIFDVDAVEGIFSSLSKFDEALRDVWSQKMDENLFRFKLNIQKSKILKGKYAFHIQLNVERGTLRRQPGTFNSLNQPFNPKAFNFTKISEAEKMFQLVNSDSPDESKHFLIVNVSPLNFGHSLIVPSLYECLPQVLTKKSLHLSLDVLLQSASPSLRVIFNSLCANASVDHLHFHALYVDQQMLLETIDVKLLSGPCYELTNFPSKGFMFELKEGECLETLLSHVFECVSLLQKKNVAHNLCMTRGRSQDIEISTPSSIRNCIRIYVWARSSTSGAKLTNSCSPAACELFGHISLTSEESYDSWTEEKVADMLNSITSDVFESVRGDIKTLFSEKA